MFFKKDKSIECLEKQEKSKSDPTAIGNLLMTSGHLTKEQLDKALELQKEKADFLLGEILVELGFISKQDFEYMMAKQNAIRNNFKTKEMKLYVEVAQRHAGSVKNAHEDLQRVANNLALKLNKG